jgi:integrase
MPRRKKVKGERRHGSGWQVYVYVNGEQVFRQFPLDSTPEDREAWRRLMRHQAPAKLPTGSLGRDAARWLQSVKHTPDYVNKRTYVLHWLQRLGKTTLRAKITSPIISTALSDMLAEGYSPTTVRHHRTALKHIWTFCDGKSAPNPVLETARPADLPPVVRHVPLEHVHAVLEKLSRKTRARLRLMFATGLPPAQMMQLTEQSWDKARHVLIVPRRKKGRGVAGRELPLSPEAEDALREFHREDAYGKYSTSAVHSAVHRACDALQLPRFRPYDLRHVHGSLLYAETGDLTTTARLLGHSGTKTAERYTASVFGTVDRQAVAKVGRAMTDILKRRELSRRKRILDSLRS